MNEAATDLFQKGLERYKAGESPDTLIPVFKDICDRSPKNPSAWMCLAWLYLLNDRAESALKAAQKSVKLDSKSPQARVNLALAMLDSGKTGVREHIDLARQAIKLDAQHRSDVQESIADGLKKKPDWNSLQRVKNWLS